MISKIWKDPVWSKVISAIIISLGGLILAIIKSVCESQTFSDSFNDILNYQIKIIYVPFMIISFWILKWIYTIIFSKKISVENKLLEYNKNTLRKINMTIDKREGVMMKWNVHFSSMDKPFVSDVNCFCTLHGELPIKFLWNRCPVDNCKNALKTVDSSAIENFAESIVLDEWDKLNGNKII
ncbi:hypothetical protein [Epilithonimonas sp.]|uniref:hypothetical protein n=1 Tax=Epilithonimonas sp. TaxID=2894511 RepID=UPI002FDF06C9